MLNMSVVKEQKIQAKLLETWNMGILFWLQNFSAFLIINIIMWYFPMMSWAAKIIIQYL